MQEFAAELSRLCPHGLDCLVNNAAVLGNFEHALDQ